MNSQKEIKRYLKCVGKNCPRYFKRNLMDDLIDHLCDYLDENPDSSFDNIVKHFGAPEKFADEYILALDEDTRKKLMSKTRWIKKGIIIGIAVIILMAIVTATWIIIENSQEVGVYYSEGISEIAWKHQRSSTIGLDFKF